MELKSIGSGCLAICIAVAICACGSIEADSNARSRRENEFARRVDLARIWVTADHAPAARPYRVLGDVTYREPFSPEAIDENGIRDKLKKMAYDKWPDSLDAVVDEKSEVSDDGSTVTVSAKAISFESSAARAASRRLIEDELSAPAR